MFFLFHFRSFPFTKEMMTRKEKKKQIHAIKLHLKYVDPE